MEEKQDDEDDNAYDDVYDYRKFGKPILTPASILQASNIDADVNVKLFLQKRYWRQQIL